MHIADAEVHPLSDLYEILRNRIYRWPWYFASIIHTSSAHFDSFCFVDWQHVDRDWGDKRRKKAIELQHASCWQHSDRPLLGLWGYAIPPVCDYRIQLIRCVGSRLHLLPHLVWTVSVKLWTNLSAIQRLVYRPTGLPSVHFLRIFMVATCAFAFAFSVLKL